MRNILPAVLSVIYMFSCAASVSACWCRHDPAVPFRVAVAKEFRGSEAVFVGEVIEQKRSQIRFKVEKVWKGEIADEIILITNSWDDGDVGSIDSCAYPFAVGSKYLIYARKSENELGASKCSRTQLLEKAEQDITELDRLRSKDRKQPPKRTARIDPFSLPRNLTTHSTGLADSIFFMVLPRVVSCIDSRRAG